MCGVMFVQCVSLNLSASAYSTLLTKTNTFFEIVTPNISKSVLLCGWEKFFASG